MYDVARSRMEGKKEMGFLNKKSPIDRDRLHFRHAASHYTGESERVTKP